MTDPRIPTLAEWGLDRVPDYRIDPKTGVEDTTWRTRWFHYRDNLIRARQTIHDGCRETHPNYRINRQLELALCKIDPARFLAIWGWIEEPRVRKGEDPIKPFTPFGYQVRLMDWLTDRLADDVAPDGYISKCRGLGASWIVCAYALHGWLFKTPWDVLLLSRKEDLVDKPKYKPSLFYKIDFLLKELPAWMIPAGYVADQPHRMKMSMTNPVTGSQLMGESTTEKSGRAARATFAVYDEAAFMPSFNDVHATGTGTTDHRVAISTESFAEGMDFHETVNLHRKQRPESVLDLDWFLNPYFDQDWYEREQSRMAHDPGAFAAEYLRDPWAAYGSMIYPGIADKPCDAAGYIAGQPVLGGIDPGFADDTAVVWFQMQPDGRYRCIDSFEQNLQTAEWFACLLTGIDPEPGDKAYGSTFSPEARRIMAWTKTLPWSDRVRYFMDPAGAQKNTSGLSFYERLIIESRKLRKREAERLQAANGEEVLGVGLKVYYKDFFAKNRHDIRHLAMRNMLLRLDIADTPGAKAWHYAMKSYRYNDPGAKATGEPKPIHDQYSHLASAGEYVALYVDGKIAIPKNDDTGKPQRRSQRAEPTKRAHPPMRKAA